MERADVQDGGSQREKAARDERRAQALRENLKRRKAQFRGRKADDRNEPKVPADRPIKSP